ncbi:MAG: hypothetical protein IT379_10195 [Deltaproteobacteria bacterium]|nr:hypothetical protein [Deltaproteobacteria bacterium]
MRISNSFSPGEIQVLDFILNSLLRGANPSMAVRQKDFPALCRKVMAMKKRLDTTEAAEPVKATGEPPKSVKENVG